MSTFVIFVIVLTLGYILYYAALITIDTTTKSKTEAATEETISVVGVSDDDEEYSPRSVVENAATGGFSFMEPEDDETDAPTEEIHEAEEADMPEEQEPLEVSTVESEAPVDAQEPMSTESESFEAEDEQPTEVPSSEESGQTVDSPSEDETVNTPDSEDAEPFSEASNLTMIEDVDEEPVQKEDDEPFDEDKAFDKTLLTPQYGVTEIVAPAVAEQTVTHAIETNSALDSILTEGFGMDVSTLKEMMHQGTNNKYGLDLTDEVQKY